MNSALRRAAILVTAVDTRSADALLEAMAPDQAAKVRDAVMDLNDVDETEREQVLNEFLTQRRKQRRAAHDGVEVDESLTSKFLHVSGKSPAAAHSIHNPRISDPAVEFATYAVEPSMQAAQPDMPKPFYFLEQVEAEGLARKLEREHPQTSAVVLAHLDPDLAAKVFRHWSEELQRQVLRRIATLDQTSPEIIADIEQELEPLFRQSGSTSVTRSKGLDAAQAILQALDDESRTSLLEEITGPSRELDHAYADRMNRPQRDNRREGRRNDSSSAPIREQSATTVAPKPAIEFTFDQLTRLDARFLAIVLHHAAPQVALLAMAGADQSLFERMTKGIPQGELRKLKHRMHHLGPVRLRDIDRAQRKLTQLAAQLAERGLIPLPSSLISSAGNRESK